MREIKFRATSESLNKECGEVLYFYSDKPDSDFEIKINKYGLALFLAEAYEENGSGVSEEFYQWEERKDAIFEQYTGLKDCNGVEIYEGDICKSNMLRGRSVCVVYDDVQCRFIYKARYQFDNSGVNTITRLENEIIGNIHDNPELLESNK